MVPLPRQAALRMRAEGGSGIGNALGTLDWRCRGAGIRIRLLADLACLSSAAALFSITFRVEWRVRCMVQDFAMIRESKSRNLPVKWSISTQVGLWVGCGVCASHLFSAGPFCMNF